ncbi:PREDICTED: RCC1 and BTB domain-containing protein 1 [Acromyrmex echinatior]|uniref:RCC1 and BTB domain-containing protein 1 n=1 Tax=Acromyrmex echinatior TaxID=103372 RepID=UPI000580FD2E|nr:PREDICTED: RCC1 and BTB domain-containing protein 1 [Acromyrmex echinatior]
MSISLKFDKNFMIEKQQNIDLINFKRWLALQSCIDYKNVSGYIDTDHHPTLVDIMFKKKIKMLIANTINKGSASLVTQDVEKYVWDNITAKITFIREVQSLVNDNEDLVGTNYNMLSHIYYTSHKIDWSNTRIVKAATNSFNFLALTDDGKIYYTKVWSGGQKCSMHQINIKEKITSMSCGKKFFVVVTNNCKVFSWGLILSEELNPSTSSPHTSKEIFLIEEPREIAAFTGKTIVKIACGNDYTLALNDKGKLYGWGSNPNGLLYLNYSENILFPIMMNIDNVKKVSDIAVIDYNNFVKSSKDGLVYAWGFIFNIPFQKSIACEYTNAFDISDSMIAHSPMSVVYEFINEEFHILNDLETAFNDQSTSDLTIMVEKQPIYVHKVILKIRSTYFRNMFQTNYVENSQRVIVNNYYRYVIYKKFLEYLYTGEINLSSFENLLDLLQLADILCDENLQMDCIRKIKKTINVSNVMYLFKLINDMNEEHHKKELMKYCLNFYFKNMTTVNWTEGFETLDVETKAMLIDKGRTFFSSKILFWLFRIIYFLV